MSCRSFNESHISVIYFKDSTILALVSAVVKWILKAEFRMVKQAFPLDHHNYVRYGAYQQKLLKHLQHTSHPAYHDLLVKCYDGNLTGERF